MQNTKKMRAAALVAGSLALVAGACGSDAADTTSNTTGGDGGGAKALKAVPGFDPATNTIKLGVLTPLTGAVASIGKPLTAGNEVWFSRINAKGGIAGKYKVQLVQEDTAYNPQQAVQTYQKIKGDVVAFTQILGTPSVNAVLPSLKSDKILAAPASLDAEWVRDPNLLPIGAPYQIQAINAMDWYINENGGKGKKICTMAQDDAYGKAGTDGIAFASTKLGFTVAKAETFKQTKGAEASAAVQSLKDAGCEAIFLVSTPSDTGAILGIAAKGAYAPTWIGQSPSWIGGLAQSALKDYLAKTFYVASEGTNWGDETVPGMKSMLADIAQFKPDQQPDYYFAFGYNQARAMTQLLEKAVADGDLSHEGLLKASEGVGTLTFDGLSGDYPYGKAAERKFPRSSTIFKVDLTKPVGLDAVKKDFSSSAAKDFEIKS